MLLTIVKKELKRVFSDRRLVFSAFIVPALSIFVIYSLMGNMVGSFIDEVEQHKSRIYIENAPESFNSYIKSIEEKLNMDLSFIVEDRDSIIEDIRYGRVDLLVVFEDDFDNLVENYESSNLPDIKTFYNPSEEYSDYARMNFILQVLNPFEEKLLSKRFEDIDVTKIFSVDANNKDSITLDSNKAAGTGLSMIMPMLLSILLFAGAMGIGIDTIAGEKERQTMATLLLTPVKRETIALGKVIGLGIVAIISALCSFGAILASMPSVAGIYTKDIEGVDISSLSFTPLQYMQLLVIMIVLVGIYVGLICLVSVKANSMKEAGTYMGPIYMIVIVAAFMTMFSSGDIGLERFAIPIMGNVLVIKRIFMFDLGINEFLVSTGVSILVCVVLLKAITKTFNNEKTMFNK